MNGNKDQHPSCRKVQEQKKLLVSSTTWDQIQITAQRRGSHQTDRNREDGSYIRTEVWAHRSPAPTFACTRQPRDRVLHVWPLRAPAGQDVEFCYLTKYTPIDSASPPDHFEHNFGLHIISTFNVTVAFLKDKNLKNNYNIIVLLKLLLTKPILSSDTANAKNFFQMQKINFSVCLRSK